MIFLRSVLSKVLGELNSKVSGEKGVITAGRVVLSRIKRVEDLHVRVE